MTGLTLRAIKLSALAAVLFAGAASAQESERSGFGFLEQLFGGSERVSPSTGQDRGQDRTSAATPDRAPPGSSPSGQSRVAQSGSELMMRIDRLEGQIRQLTGAIEQLQYRNQQLEGQLRRLQPQQDGDYRVQDGGAAPRSAPTVRPGMPPPVGQQQPPAAPPGRRGDAFDPNANPNAPGAPRTLGSVPGNVAQSGVHDADEPVGAPGGRPAGAPLDLSTLAGAPGADPSLSTGMAAPGGELPAQRNPGGAGGQLATLPPTNSPKDTYDLAYGYVLRRDYALAEESFRAFLHRYPSDRLASDAQYWLGESLFQRQRYRDAAESFLNVSTKYETAARAPDALLRLGQALAAMGEKDAACASFAEVGRKYPRASVSVKQGVDREQKRVRC